MDICAGAQQAAERIAAVVDKKHCLKSSGEPGAGEMAFY
jgi:hypothetical protein